MGWWGKTKKWVEKNWEETLTGAAVGTAAAPGIGTIVGAGLGATAGTVTEGKAVNVGGGGGGGGGDAKVKEPEKPDIQPAELGTVGRERAQQAVMQAQERTGPDAVSVSSIAPSAGVAGMRAGSGIAAQARATSIDQANQAQWRSQQQALAQQLGLQATGRGGPSPAELMMKQGMQQAMRQQIAMSRSGPLAMRGVAQRQATSNIAGISQDVLTQMGIQRAQEQQQAREQLGTLLGQARGQDIGLATSAAQLIQERNLANMQAQQQMSVENLRAAQEAERVNLASRSAIEQANIETARQQQQLQTQAGLQQQQVEMQQRQLNDAMTQYYMNMGMAEDMARMQAQQDADTLRAQLYGVEKGAQVQLQTATPEWAYWLGPAMQLGGTMAVEGGKALSDEDVKVKKRKVAKALDQFVKTLEPWSYNYAHEPDRRSYGIMAQDLEKSKIGSSLVSEYGTVKTIDLGRGFGVALAALKRLQQRIDKLEGAAHA